MSAPTGNAIKNNNKALDSYAQKLTSDHLQTYVRFTDRFGEWLKSDKAYYTMARPKILELLEIAQSTLNRQRGRKDNLSVTPSDTKLIKPWIDAYTRLVQQVLPHRTRFIEPGFQDRLNNLVNDISGGSVETGAASLQQANPVPPSSETSHVPLPTPSVAPGASSLAFSLGKPANVSPKKPNSPLPPTDVTTPSPTPRQDQNQPQHVHKQRQVNLSRTQDSVATKSPEPTLISPETISSGHTAPAPSKLPVVASTISASQKIPATSISAPSKPSAAMPPAAFALPKPPTIVPTAPAPPKLPHSVLGFPKQPATVPTVVSAPSKPYVIASAMPALIKPPTIAPTLPTPPRRSAIASTVPSPHKLSAIVMVAEPPKPPVMASTAHGHSKMSATSEIATTPLKLPITPPTASASPEPSATTPTVPPKLPTNVLYHPAESQTLGSTQSATHTKSKLKKKSKIASDDAAFLMADLKEYQSRGKEKVEVVATDSSVIPSDQASTAAIQPITAMAVDQPTRPASPSDKPPNLAPVSMQHVVASAEAHSVPPDDSLQEAMRVTKELLSDTPEVDHESVSGISQPAPTFVSMESSGEEFITPVTSLDGVDERHISNTHPLAENVPYGSVSEQPESPTALALKSHPTNATETASQEMDLHLEECPTLTMTESPSVSKPLFEMEVTQEPHNTIEENPLIISAQAPPSATFVGNTDSIRDVTIGDQIPKISLTLNPAPQDPVCDPKRMTVNNQDPESMDVDEGPCMDHLSPSPLYRSHEERAPSDDDGAVSMELESDLEKSRSDDMVMHASDLKTADGRENPNNEGPNSSIDDRNLSIEMEFDADKSKGDATVQEVQAKKPDVAGKKGLNNGTGSRGASMEIDTEVEKSKSDEPVIQNSNLAKHLEDPTIGGISQGDEPMQVGEDANGIGRSLLPQANVPEPHSTVSGAGQRVFGPEMVPIAIQRGSSDESTISIDFSIDNEQSIVASKWNNRNSTTEDVSDALCLSLACYSCTDVQALLGRTPDASTYPHIDELVACGSTWPDVAGAVSVNVRYKEGRNTFPLSPPYFVTPDNMFDVTEFLELGENCLHIMQYADMSQWIFVLHAHFPTAKQLAEVEKKRQLDKEWEDWVHRIRTRPLDADFPPELRSSGRALRSG